MIVDNDDSSYDNDDSSYYIDDGSCCIPNIIVTMFKGIPRH